jgi:hypothetical protein
MNDRTYLQLATLVALLVAVPTTIQAAPGGQTSAPAGGTSAHTPTAAEAARLAAAAADMAQRAAKLAAEAQRSADSSSAWHARGAATSQPAARPTAPYPVTAASKIPAAEDASQSDTLQWRQINPAGADGHSQAADSASALFAGVAAGPAASGDKTTGQSPSASHAISDGQVVPAASAQYPETLVSGAEFSIPVSYEGCTDGSCTNGGCTDGCCTDGCCGDMACCCPQPRPLSWVMGVEATWLHPDLNNVAPRFDVEDVTFDRFTSFSANSADVDSFYISPRIWLGIQGCEWGTQVRYWHMNVGEFNFDEFFDNHGSPNLGVPDASYFASGRLDAYTIDWEITRRFCVHDCQMVLSGGVRYALIQSDQSVTGLSSTLTNPDDDETSVLLSGYSRSDNISRGTGLVLGLSGIQPLFPCSCVQLFWNLRGSVMWGPTNTYSESFASVAVFDPAATADAASVNSASTAVNDDLFIGEVQLGLQWNYNLCCVPANAFVRTAVEYQRWDGGRGSSSTGSTAGAYVDSDLAAAVETSSSAAGPELDLIGFTIGAGLTW